MKSKKGEVVFEGELVNLVFRREIPHAIDKVWEAISNPDELSQWFVSSAYLEPRKGGNVEFVAAPMPIRWAGKLLEWNPPNLLVYEFHTDPNPHMPLGEKATARWELTELEGGATRLALSFARFTKGTGLGFAPGTHAFLDRLEALLSGTPLPDWMTRYGEVKDQYPNWQS